jgi:hypothetical protein
MSHFMAQSIVLSFFYINLSYLKISLSNVIIKQSKAYEQNLQSKLAFQKI